MSKKKKIIAAIVAIIFLLISLGLIFYPVWSTWYLDQHQAELELEYLEQLAEKDDSMIKEVWEAAEEYNRAIIPGTQNESAFTQEAQLKAAQNYASMLNINGDSIMGYVEIPKIDVKLPIFHGTDNDTLERGAGHLVGSSLPIGGESTHSVITAHSGMASMRAFSDLEDLVVGDIFYIKVLNETLAYQVDQINIVLPHEVSNLCIVDGEDYCTLITCTPYAVNTHRLLVRGTRIDYEEAEKLIEEAPVEETNVSTWEKGYLKGIVRGLIFFVILLIIAVIANLISKAVKRSKMKAIPVVADSEDEDKPNEEQTE